MPMTLYCTRAKSFVSDDGNGTKQFHLMPGPHPVPVPFWVAETATFKHSIKDKSIINLTPPEQMPGYKAAPVAETDEVEDHDGLDLPAGTTEDAAEETSMPQAPFGAQPMTPVPPAPRVGRVRAANSRS